MRKREKRVRGEKDVEREDVTDMKHSQDRVAARNKTSWSPKASLNVTQAADHKGEMARKKKKKNLYPNRFPVPNGQSNE